MIKIISGDLAKIDTPCLVVPVCEDKKLFNLPLIAGLIQKAIKSNDFKAKSGDEICLYNIAEVRAKRILFIGLGKSKKINRETLRAAAGKAVKRCIKKNILSMTFCVYSGICNTRSMGLESLLWARGVPRESKR